MPNRSREIREDLYDDHGHHNWGQKKLKERVEAQNKKDHYERMRNAKRRKVASEESEDSEDEVT